MARQSSSRLHTRAAALLAMASTASAMSLSNFQIITSSQIPLSCLVAYNTPILGCSESDFTKGNTCSAVCAMGLQSVEDTVASLCRGVTVSSTTILGQALSGNLVEKLCPSGTAAPPTTASPAKSPQSTRSIGTFQPIPTPSTLRTLTTTTTSSSSLSSSSSMSSTSTTAEDDDDTETSTSSEPAAEPTDNAQPTTQVEAPAPAVTNGPPAGQTTGAQQTKAAPPQTADDGSPGGGSPFDTIATVSSGASRRQLVVVRWLEACLLANVFVFMLRR